MHTTFCRTYVCIYVSMSLLLMLTIILFSSCIYIHDSCNIYTYIYTHTTIMIYIAVFLKYAVLLILHFADGKEGRERSNNNEVKETELQAVEIADCQCPNPNLYRII